ncbi:MAG: PIG-L family deacetylase [Anaerolineales bacterium]|nr:PIG-L family deacetylase [Anaerolineales bacterium]
MNILAFFAHPDDETILIGGTLALLAQQGAQVHYLCATRGEGGENGEPPLCALDELGEVRAKELACAVEALGGSKLTIMGYVDPHVGEDEALFSFTDDLAKLADEVRKAILTFQIDAVITHGVNGEYGHPAHLTCNQAARQAIELLGEDAPLLYTVFPDFPGNPMPRLSNQDENADLVVDINATFADKLAAARCHQTQNALFVRWMSKELGRQIDLPEVILKLESLRRVSPEIPPGQLENDPLAIMFSIAGALRSTMEEE